jgi:hypothetical protein
MVLVYAANADLTAWINPVPLPANSATLLRSASLLIHSYTMTALYGVDSTGLPSDATVLQAFNDATCAQVAAWIAAGIDPVSGGIPTTALVRSKRLGSGAIDYDTSANSSVTVLQAKREAATTLCAEAVMILHQVRVIPGGVQRGRP